MPHPNSLGIRHEVLALVPEGMQQSNITCHMGLTHATVNGIFQRHAATGSLVPDKSMGVPRKITPRQDCALFRMVQQDLFVSYLALTAQIKNLSGIRAGRKAINNRLLSWVRLPIDLQRSPC